MELQLAELVWLGNDARIHRATDASGASLAVKQCIARELQVLLRLPPHEHIVRIVGACSSPTAYAMPFAQGTLYDRVPLGAPSVRRQLLDAIAHLHAHGILHRDVKPSNVLVYDGHHLRLADFGTAVVSLDHVDEVVTTYAYAAPEVLREGHYTTAADVWGVGMTLAEVLLRRRVLQSSSLARVAEEQATLLPYVRERVPRCVARLIDDCPAVRVEWHSSNVDAS